MTNYNNSSVKTMQVQMLLLLITIGLFKTSLCFHAGEQMHYLKSSKFLDNDFKSLPPDNSRTKRDITIPVLTPNQRNIVVPDIAKFLKLLRVPGYSVQLLDFNDENDQRKYENNGHNSKLPVFFNSRSKPRDLYENKLTSGLRFLNDSGLTNSNNNMKINSGNTHNGCEIDKNCSDRDFKETKNVMEETTTDIIEVTTTYGDVLNENSTVLSEYDNEEYGSISDRADISPSLLASLVG